MRVAELAKELKTTEAVILEKLKTLKMKAKGPKKELNAVVVSVLKTELKKGGGAKASTTKKKTATKKTPTKKAATKTTKKTTTKTTKKATTKTKTKIAKKVTVKKTTTTKKTTAKAKETKKETKKEETKKPVETPAKPKPKVKKINIIDAPFEPVKPLAKKRKKTTSKDEKQKPPAPPQESVVAKAEEIVQEDVDPEVLAQQEKEAKEQKLQAVQDSIKGFSDMEALELVFPISVKDLAVRIGQKPSVVLQELVKKGIFANINQSIDEEVATLLASVFGFRVLKGKTQEEKLIETHQEEQDDPSLLKPRAPVVTFMGHVDHGKTSLLDRIRKSKIADAEHGGITQHIGAYSVNIKKGRIAFLDTPGHEAFTSMRARGAHITDVVVVVIAADEGIMPQTEEAIDHARAAEVPIIIALNKIDRKNADIDRVKKQLADHDLNPEDWGGKTVCVPVSAITGDGIDQLLEMILLEAELLELKANAQKGASGIIIEAHLSHGKGAVASLIVQNGTLNENDVIVVGPHYGKIRAMFDDHHRPVKTAGPSTPVEILGLPGVPEAGDMFYVVEDEKTAREISMKRQEAARAEKLRSTQKLTLEDLYSKIQEGTVKELNIIMKADVQGSLEALKESIAKIPSDQIQIKFIHTGVGDINASDIILADASDAIIIGFHVGFGPRAKAELEKHPVDIRTYRIIYDAVNEIRNALEGMLEPIKKKKALGAFEIRQVFKLSKAGVVAGCYVIKGKIHRKAHIDLVRNGETVFSGTIKSLKRFKDDVKDVAEGFECGVTIEGFSEIEVGDVIEAYDVEQVARKL